MSKKKAMPSYKYARVKKRYWTFLVYPESAPKDWKDRLQMTGLPVAISPVHDKDTNPGSEEVKKAHHHVILCYEGPTTGSNVKRLTDELNQPTPMPIDSVRGLYRYFTHKDNPEKHQYDEKDVETLNGFSISDYADLSSSDRSAIKLELTRLIKEQGLTEYSDFMDTVIELDKPDYFYIASNSTIYFNAYLTSRRHRELDDVSYIYIDTSTGEVVEDSTEEPEMVEKEE